MDVSFKCLKIIVTGAGRGIGRGIVNALLNGPQAAEEVIAVSQTQSNLDSLVKENQNSKAKLTCIQVDLSDWDATEKALKNLPPVHGLVNNAAIIQFESFLCIKKETFDKLFKVNVRAIIQVSQIVAKKMIENNIQGSIVNISSVASQAAVKDHTVYCATKAAVDQMTRVMALELGAYGIRSNCINPTVVMTDMGRQGWSDPEKQKALKSKIPLGRFAEVDEVVHAVLYFLNDKSSMINGTILPIDGGFLGT